MTMGASFAAKGSKRWLHVAITIAPDILEQAFKSSGAIELDEVPHWRSPLAVDGFKEYRDSEFLRKLGIDKLPIRQLSSFWPNMGPRWDGLAITNHKSLILVEAKAHLNEISKSSLGATDQTSIDKIKAGLEEARQYYAPHTSKTWSNKYYQYVNRLAHHYFLGQVNLLPSRLIFLYFCNARDMSGPTSAAQWVVKTRQVHHDLGLPESLASVGVFDAYVDVAELESRLQ